MDISQSDINTAFDRFNSKPRSLLEAVEQNRLKNQQNQQNEMALRKQQQDVNFNEQANPLKLAKAQFDNMSEQDKFVEQELLQGSIELQPFLDAKDSQSVMQSLQMRRNKLAQNGLRTDEIDNAIQLAQQGDFDTLKQLTGSQIRAGKALGLLENQERGGGTGVIMDRLMAQDPNLTEYDALLMAQGLGRQGLRPTGDGGVGQIGGYGDNRASIEGQIAGSKADAQIPAFQDKSNIKVNETRQTSDITTQNKISEKEKIEQDKIIVDAQVNYPKIEQQAEETLNLVDRLINNPSLYDASGIIQSQIPTIFQDTKDFQLLNEQLTNQTFLQAFQQLRGGGQITDIEGLKASLAKLQNSLSGSPKLFIESAKNLQKQIIKSTRNAKNLADGKVFYKTQGNEQPQTMQQPQQSNQPQERIRTYNPQTGNFE